MASLVDDLLITDEDARRLSGGAMTAAPQKPAPHTGPAAGNEPPASSDPETAIALKVAPRVAEAQLIKVVDQPTLNIVGERLAANKALQKEAAEVFDPVIQAAHEAHKKAIAAKKKITDPLTQEEAILKGAAQVYVLEQQRLASEREREERQRREAEERRLLLQAEEDRKRRQEEINAQLEKEHAEEVERALENLPADTPQEVIQAICESPAPEPVIIPLEIPELAPVVPVSTVQMPKGMSITKRYKAEVTSLALLCRAVAEGKVPSSYVTANMSALNTRANADKLEFSVPGVRAVPDSTMSQRSR